MLIAHPPMLFGGAAWTSLRLWGIGAGLLAAVCAAGAFLSLRALGTKEDAITTSLWFHSMAALSCVLPLALSYPTPARWPNVQQVVLLLTVAVTSFGGQLLLARGFQLLAASSAAAINLTQVVHAHILSAAFLHEELHWYSVLGSLFIGAGAVLVHQKQSAPPSKQTDWADHADASPPVTVEMSEPPKAVPKV